MIAANERATMLVLKGSASFAPRMPAAMLEVEANPEVLSEERRAAKTISDRTRIVFNVLLSITWRSLRRELTIASFT